MNPPGRPLALLALSSVAAFIVGALAGWGSGGGGRRVRPDVPRRPLTPAESEAFEQLAVEYYTRSNP